MLLQLENIARHFPEIDLFEGVCLQVNDGDRLGLVGPNGSGKSQLLGIMAGTVAPDAGRVNLRSRLRVGKLDQEVRVDAGRALFDETLEVFRPLMDLEVEIARLEHEISDHHESDRLDGSLRRYSDAKERYEREGGYSYRSRTEAVLLGIGFARAELDQPCAFLSGGQLNRLGLARLLLEGADLLLLDEPTNHLDLKAVRWLEEYLQAWDRAYVVVSHDRYFLDRVCRGIWEIANRRVNTYVGNYTRFQADRVKRLEQQRKEYESQAEFIQKTQDFIRRNIYGQKTKQAQSRRRMLEKLERVERPTEDARRIRLNLSDVSRSSDTVLVLENLVLGYDAPLVEVPLELTVTRGDRIGILGENGTGKTTLFRALLGQIPPLGGSYRWGRNVSIGYFDQKMETLSASPIQEIRTLDPLAQEGDIRNFLARFGFWDDDVFKPLSALSGGEKNRLLLARLIYARHNVLILDEPTNHLDIASREELEAALDAFPGTLLVISHDRYFLDRIVNRILSVHDGTADFHFGNYSEWEAWESRRSAAREAAAEAARAVPERTPERPRDGAGGDGRPEGLSKNERFRLEAQMAEVETEIAQMEARLSEIERTLQDPSPGMASDAFARLGQEHADTAARLAGLYGRWEELGSRLEP
ncbi:MAG: ABC-F family ATP-binding cassette domain-containing protein [Acidobacteria bacterium]|nr:ABC-F family ATP-binding cassette domain-containing protein [Acidobacteriota bacterium]